MILRKPYAFLIKHFKFIHIVLTILMFLFFQDIREVLKFFNEYIGLNTYERITGVVRDNFNMWYILLPIIIIAFIIMIMWLLITKQKPVKYYVFALVSYILEIVIMIIAYIAMVTIQQGEPNSNLFTIYRDLLELFSYLPIPLIIVSLARGVGFNVKHFNFKKDMSELDISDEDNEEFEVEVNVDTEDIKAKFNRRKRMIKYTYLENKLVFWIVGIVSVITIIIGTILFINRDGIVFKEGKSFDAYDVTVTINNSYKVNDTSVGKIIKKDRFYIVVQLSLKNKLNEQNKLPYSKIYLRVTEELKYSPIDDYSEVFNEYGIRYNSKSSLLAKEEKEVILVYELEEKYKDSKFVLEYLTNEKEKNGEFHYEYQKISLTPKTYDEAKKVSEKKLGEILSFEKSLLDGTELMISEVEFNDKYSYTYKQTIGNVEKEFVKTIIPTDVSTYRKTIMRLKTDLNKNELLNQKVYSSLYAKYGIIEYVTNGKTTRQKPNIIDLTPSKSEYTYLEVVYQAKEADEVNLVFKVRDKEYKYNLVKKEENNE